MARRRWYRRYPRVVAAKKKWASNFKMGTVASVSDSPTVLVENSTDSTVPTPVIIKTGNFKVQGDVTISSTSGVGDTFLSLTVFLVFVPEGMTALNAVSYHPEYILGWTVVDCPTLPSGSTYQSANKFSISTRLKRNLNSGDKVVLCYNAVTPSSVGPVIRYNAQFFTCAN